MDDIAIKVENLSKSFNIPTEKNNSLKSYFLNPFSLFYNKKKKFQALKDINFEVKRGEFVGIIGRNGSGKSTLLKILSNIYKPDSGRIFVNGQIVSFLELGVGFNPELSASENIYLNGTILGMGRDYINNNFNDIVKFAELEEFLQMPIKNFSSGMIVRLAFSIAIKAKADIFLLDEIMEVGDTGFQKKSHDVLKELKKQDKTIIVISHNLKNIENFCDRVILFDQGNKVLEGDFNTVLYEYNNIINKNLNKKILNKNDYLNNRNNKKIEFVSLKLYKQNRETYSLISNDFCKVEIIAKSIQEINKLTVSCHFMTEKDVSVVYLRKKFDNIFINKGQTFKICFEQKLNFVSGRYKCFLAIGPKDLSPRSYYDNNFSGSKQPISFSVSNSNNKLGFIDLKSKIYLIKNK